jgi:uncharacterized protein (TIGR00730 family)
MTPRSVCVFCGSRTGREPAFEADAARLGTALAEAGWRLVYGAGEVGLMGAVSRAARAAGGDTLGVIPGHLVGLEAGAAGHVVTETMHERKKVMFMNSDAIVVLPGGAGSLDEFFEVLTWRQLGLHDKPLCLLNTAGYWTPLMELLDHAVAAGFADASLTELVRVCDTVQDLCASLRAALS